MFEIIICIIAGLGAGLGTGFAGMSAAVVISPMLVTFLKVNPHEAIGIALASDVLASAISAYTYGKNKNIDIKNSKWLFASVICFTFVGAFVSNLVPTATMGNFTVFASTIVGIQFLFKKEKENSAGLRQFKGSLKIIVPILCGALIGMMCGFVGAGGGMAMLIILTGILGYDLKVAVGTSVFIMTFTALFGSISHFTLEGNFPEPLIFTVCVISTLVFARIGAKIANKAKPRVLNKTVGAILTTLGVVLIVVTYF